MSSRKAPLSLRSPSIVLQDAYQFHQGVPKSSSTEAPFPTVCVPWRSAWHIIDTQHTYATVSRSNVAGFRQQEGHIPRCPLLTLEGLEKEGLTHRGNVREAVKVKPLCLPVAEIAHVLFLLAKK